MNTVYRKLLPQEFPLYEEHLHRLNAMDRGTRFHAALSDEAIARHCAKLAAAPVWIVGWFVDGVLRGAAELHAERQHWLDGAELAVSVEQPWQGQGVGSELVRRALTIARNRDLTRVGMICLRSNVRMRRIAKKVHGALEAEDGDLVAEMEVGGPTPQSLFEEMVDDETALIAMALTWWANAVTALLRPPVARAA
jgi:RimJ/RimL family protein N-acetyltransferase